MRFLAASAYSAYAHNLHEPHICIRMANPSVKSSLIQITDTKSYIDGYKNNTNSEDANCYLGQACVKYLTIIMSCLIKWVPLDTWLIKRVPLDTYQLG